ncbi:MAG: TylF/MycF/NovP-related O-methyltransferase [Bdellovibrionales bacterium]
MEISLQDIYKNLLRIRDWSLVTKASVCHSVIITSASYSPWGDDVEFLSVYDIIRGNTLVDLYRCYELWSLVRQMASVEGDILEIGVWRGGSGCLMAKRAQAVAPSKKVFLCDTFEGVVKASEHDTKYIGGEHSDTSVDTVLGLAGKAGVNNIEVLKGMFPEKTAHLIADRKFCLCHIDVDVYESARDIANWVWPRISVGGCLIFDDYGFPTCDGIRRYVDETFPRTGSLFIHNLNGHAVIIKMRD